jgi:hypothetical protein
MTPAYARSAAVALDTRRAAPYTVETKSRRSKARTYYVVRCRSCGRLGSYESLDQARARVDQHRSHSTQTDHEVVITTHPQSKR